MNELERKALRFTQAGTPFYILVFSGLELKTNTRTPWYDPVTETGYQRKPRDTRIKKAAKYLQEGGTFPTSVLVNCRKPLDFRIEADLGIFQYGALRIPEDADLNLVDGQTRELGIEAAVNGLGVEGLDDFGLPVVLSNFPDEFTEMQHFRTINREQKSVPTDLTDRLLAKELHQKSSQEELIRSGKMGILRSWKAVQVARLLNERDESPWKDLVKPPNTQGSSASLSMVSERSMSQSLKDVIRRMETFTPEEIAKVVVNYWRAVMKRCELASNDKDGYPYLWNTTGIYTMHMLFPAVYERALGDTSVENFERLLSKISELRSDMWVKDGDLKGIGGIGGFKKVSSELTAELIHGG